MGKIETKTTLQVTFLALLSFFLYSSKINLGNSDIGRHIKNGELMRETSEIIKTNLYSYTQPDFVTINHHWGSGVLYSVVHDLFGFTGISITNSLMMVGCVVLLFLTVKKRTSSEVALIAVLVSLPLLLSRKEVRPEIISYLLISSYFFIIETFKDLQNQKLLWLLVPLQIAWVNLHIFFVFGVFVIGIYAFGEIINKTKNAKAFLLLTAALGATTLLNPLGLTGALVPLTIFEEFGYRLAENQTIFFMLGLFPKPLYGYILIVFGVVLEILFMSLHKNHSKRHIMTLLPYLLFITTGLILGVKMIRLFPLAVLFLLTGISPFLDTKKTLTKFPGTNFYIELMLVTLVVGSIYFAQTPTKGLGLLPNMPDAANFIAENRLSGPIFNNYDNGGYIIYYLYPQHKVFVDNRPEAYSVEFFTKIYLPMQETDTVWQEQLEKYDFNTIFFWRHDLTPWGQQFLVTRLSDPEWIPIYVDQYFIIFVRDTETNATIIENHKLPDELFSVRGT